MGRCPDEEASPPRRDQFRIFLGKVESFFGIGLEVEELCTPGIEFRDEFPFSIARARERQGVIREKKRGTRAREKQ